MDGQVFVMLPLSFKQVNIARLEYITQRHSVFIINSGHSLNYNYMTVQTIEHQAVEASRVKSGLGL